MRSSAATVLGEVPQLPEVVQALLAALRDEDEEVRNKAAEALGNVTQFPEVVKALLVALQDEKAKVCVRAAQALRSITQSIRFKSFRTLPEQLASSFLFPHSGTEEFLLIKHDYQRYSVSDLLFDSLMAVAGSAEVK